MVNFSVKLIAKKNVGYCQKNRQTIDCPVQISQSFCLKMNKTVKAPFGVHVIKCLILKFIHSGVSCYL